MLTSGPFIPFVPCVPGRALRSLWNTRGSWRPHSVIAASDGELRRSMIGVLARDGFVVSATNDVEMLPALAERRQRESGQNPEVVLVEWVASGRTVAALREAGTLLSGSAVLLLSRVLDEPVLRAAESLGVRAVFHPPFDLLELRDLAFQLVA